MYVSMYMHVYTIAVIPGVDNCIHNAFCRALGSSHWETIAQSTKVSAEHHNTTCTSSVDFYMVAEQTILVRQSRWTRTTTTAHIQTKQYADCLRKAVNNNSNNGIPSTSRGITTSRRYNGTKPNQHAQVQNATTNIHRRVWYLRGMEIQIPGVHGINGQQATTIARELRSCNINN